MEVDILLEACNDFEKKGKKEPSPVLEQFLCHIAKTGDTLIQWSQFKSYFVYKLEKVMEDFHASYPEQRGSPNPNVDYIPYGEMKERILKIVDGYQGIPFTIQRLCELLTEPKRNYSGTEKFLRGVEKNVMVVSCIYPRSEKNESTNISKVNGDVSGNSVTYTVRKANGPDSPRTLSRPTAKHFFSIFAATNGLPDSTERKKSLAESTQKALSDSASSSTSSSSSTSEADSSHSSLMKNKHLHEEEDEEDDCSAEAKGQEAKRAKLDKDDLEVEEDDDDEEDNEEDDEDDEYEEGKFSPESNEPPSSSSLPQSSTDVNTKANVESSPTEEPASEEQEPSSTQTEPLDSADSKSESETSPEPAHEQGNRVALDQSEESCTVSSRAGQSESGDPVSSSEEGKPGEESTCAKPSSPAEGSASAVGSSLDSTDAPAEQTSEED
ncbi:serine/threonine-protein phosphatase 4 regulatory subunit 2-A-like [Engraulis encrasicolus]|uniref:serine/threonine-protein phosphatase 4 regulatory subunit 2-A-like n=1 Tax=Engraulis encrasicolus TaxID=184585 RepID=UPI002FD5AC5F